jgi:hypothetical protein
MDSYNRLKKIVSYLNFIFGIYVWVLIAYALLRFTSLIKRIPLQEHGLGYYLSLPMKFILNFF